MEVDAQVSSALSITGSERVWKQTHLLRKRSGQAGRSTVEGQRWV